MSKKKRIRRDIEKYFRSGRYWELLRLLESEDLVSANSREYRDSWEAVIGAALKSEAGFDQFRRESATLEKLPDYPGLRFLKLLEGYIEGRCSDADLLDLKGPPPDAERLRSNFAAFVSTYPNRHKLRTTLKKFLTEPEKVTPRHYEQAAAMLPRKLGAKVAFLGKLISNARRFNQKNVAAGGWDAVYSTEIEDLDRRLLDLTEPIPPALREVILHPFVHNLAVMCRRLATDPDATHNGASELLGAMPFLLPRLAGNGIDELEGKLSLDSKKSSGSDREDQPDGLALKTDGLSLEEKLALLSALRVKIRGARPDDSDIDLSDTFDEEDEWDDGLFPKEPDSELTQLTRRLFLLYRPILGDISQRLPGLSAREKKELPRVVEPILLQDLEYTRNFIPVETDVADFLDSVLKANCAGVKLGLLTLLIASHHRNGDLRRRAEKHLDQLPDPTPDDMEWLAREWDEYYFPKIRSLKPLLTRYRNDQGISSVFSQQICANLEFSICRPLILADFERFALGESKTAKAEEPRIVRRELDALTEYKSLDTVRHYLRCYSDDRFSAEGYLCWLKYLRSYLPDKVWRIALDEMTRAGEVRKSDDFDLFALRSLDGMIAEKLQTLILFMTEYSDELAGLSMEILIPILDEIHSQWNILRKHPSFLIRLEKLLAGRVEAGDTSARPAMDKIRNILQKLAKKRTGPKSPKKRKHGK